MKINKINIPEQLNENEIINIKGGLALDHDVKDAGCTCNCWFSNENESSTEEQTVQVNKLI